MTDGENRPPGTAPGGRFLLLGSGEFEDWVGETELESLRQARGAGHVAVLATASAPEGTAVFQRWNSSGIAHYLKLGVEALAVEVRDRSDAHDPAKIQAVATASMVFLSGGNPRYLHETLKETPLLDGIKELLSRGGVYAGCSAGAMVAGAALPQSGGVTRLAFGQGLGLVSTHVFGVHWDAAMMRPWRSLISARVPAHYRLLGIAEKTAVTTTAQGWRVSGEGTVDQRLDRRRRCYSAGDTIAY